MHIRISMALLAVLACAATIFTSVAASADEAWPLRPVRLVIGYGAGGGTDILSRIVAEPLSKVLGQPVVVENRPGAGGTIGADVAAKSDADGYTMFMMNNGHAVAAVVYKSLPYDPIDDFETISLVAKMPLVLVARPDFEAGNLQEVAKLAKDKPGTLNYGSVGVGSSQHFAGALLQQVAGLDITHIPYQKTPAAVAALLSGEVQLLVEVVAPVLGQVKGGDMKAIAITAAERYPSLPDVPTVAEAGFPEYDVATWYGLAFPTGTSEAIVKKMNAALQKVLASDEVREQALKAGYVLKASSPSELEQHLTGEVAKWKKVRESANIPQH